MLERNFCRELVTLIREEGERGSNAAHWVVNGLIHALISSVMELDTSALSSKQDSLNINNRGKSAVEHARQYIQEHYNEKLTLSTIAWHVQLSGEYLERLFKQHLGYTVFQYLSRIRIQQVKQDLLNTELPVFQIAARNGFSSATLLNRHFKSATGMTPLSFRVQAQEREDFAPAQMRKAD